MSRRGWWRTSFLAVTALALGMEIFASADGDEQTDPWTDMIVTYVPGEVTTAAIGGLTLWLMVHFGKRYLNKRKSDTNPTG